MLRLLSPRCCLLFLPPLLLRPPWAHTGLRQEGLHRPRPQLDLLVPAQVRMRQLLPMLPPPTQARCRQPQRRRQKQQQQQQQLPHLPNSFLRWPLRWRKLWGRLHPMATRSCSTLMGSQSRLALAGNRPGPAEVAAGDSGRTVCAYAMARSALALRARRPTERRQTPWSEQCACN